MHLGTVRWVHRKNSQSHSPGSSTPYLSKATDSLSSHFENKPHYRSDGQWIRALEKHSAQAHLSAAMGICPTAALDGDPFVRFEAYAGISALVPLSDQSLALTRGFANTLFLSCCRSILSMRVDLAAGGAYCLEQEGFYTAYLRGETGMKRKSFIPLI